MTRTWRGSAVLLASSLVLVAGTGCSAMLTPAAGADPGVQLSAPGNPSGTQRFAGGPMPPLGEPPNQAHTASSTYRLLPVTLPGPDSSNQATTFIRKR
jgi:hypothetical protein